MTASVSGSPNEGQGGKMDNNGYNNYGNQGGYQGGMPNGNYGYNGGVPQQNAGSGFAITSLVCGILSILCGCGTAGISMVTIPLLATLAAGVPAIMSIIFGIVASKKGQPKGLIIAGIICGTIGLLIAIGMLVYFILLAGVIGVGLISDYM